MNESLRKLVEGDRLWGTVDVSPAGRAVWQRIRVTVYPPGTTSGERRLLHFAHAWPILGAFLSLVVLVAPGPSYPAPLELLAALAFYAAGFWAGARLTRSLRARVRIVSTATEYVGGELCTFGEHDLLRTTLADFERIDALRNTEDISPVRYEAEWAAIYNTLASPPGPVLPRVVCQGLDAEVPRALPSAKTRLREGMLTMGAGEKFEGAADKVKGKVTEAVGRATDDPAKVIKGKAEQVKGDAKMKAADLTDKLHDDTDDPGRA